MFRRDWKAAPREARNSPRLAIDCRVEITWKADAGTRRLEARCHDIAVGGARIEIGESIPVSTPIHLRFVDDLNFEADAVVRHVSRDGFIGVEFTRMMFCGALVRHKPRPLASRLASPLVTVSAFLLLGAWLSGFLPDWRPFASMGPGPPPPAWSTRPYFTLGSSRTDVQALQGTPTSATNTVWNYGSSRVYFRSDRVTGWSSSKKAPLHVGANRIDSQPAKPESFTVGSSPEEVLAIQGAPDELTGNVWRYGSSEVYFRDGRVVAWKSSTDEPLKSTTKVSRADARG